MTAKELLNELATLCADGKGNWLIGFGIDGFTEVGSTRCQDDPRRITLETVSGAEAVRLEILRGREASEDGTDTR